MALVLTTAGERELIRTVSAATDVPAANPPACVRDNQPRFKAGRWATYSWEELYWWVKLLCKRADNRAEADKAQKDVADAQNYFAMAQAKLAHLANAATPSLDDLLDAETGAQYVAAMTAELEKAVTTLDRAPRGEGQTP